jgi:aspartate aminotransferase
MEFISNRASRMEESVTIKMAALATELKEQGKDIISLTLGEPDFNVPDFIKDSAKKAIDDNYSSYTPVPGYKDLRQSICNKFKRDNNIDHKINEIVVSTGAKQSLMNVILATVNPGEEVVLPAPYWVSYIEMVKFADGIPIIINTGIETGFKITPEKLDSALNEKTKAFLFSNPCNPSGAAYSEEEINALVKVFEKYPNTLIISDEIYEYISFAGKNISLGSYPSIKDRVVTVNGLSKGYAMTGWRIGYLGAPEAVAKACIKIQGQFTSGANAIAQRAAITALDADPSKIAFMQEKFLARRDLMISKLEIIDGLEVNTPQGAFYLFPDVSAFFGKSFNGFKVKDSDDMCAYLIEEALVATTPGSAFGCPKNIRLSYATSEDQLIDAGKRFKEALDKLA